MEELEFNEFSEYGDAFSASGFYGTYCGCETVHCSVTKEYKYERGGNPMCVRITGKQPDSIGGRFINQTLWPNRMQDEELKDTLKSLTAFDAIIKFGVYIEYEMKDGIKTVVSQRIASTPRWVGWYDEEGPHFFTGERMPAPESK